MRHASVESRVFPTNRPDTDDLERVEPLGISLDSTEVAASYFSLDRPTVEEISVSLALEVADDGKTSEPNEDARDLLRYVASTSLKFGGIHLEDLTLSSERHNKDEWAENNVINCWRYTSLGIVSTVLMSVGSWKISGSMAFGLSMVISGVNVILKVPLFGSKPWQEAISVALLSLRAEDARDIRGALHPLAPILRVPYFAMFFSYTLMFILPASIFMLRYPSTLNDYWPWAATMLVGFMLFQPVFFRACCSTFLIFDIHIRAVTRNSNSFVTTARASNAIILREKAIRSSAEHEKFVVSLLDELGFDFVRIQTQVETLTDVYATYFTLVEFVLVFLVISLAFAGTQFFTVASEISSNRQQTEFKSLLYGIMSWYWFCLNLFAALLLIFYRAVELTASCENCLTSLRSLALSVPGSQAESHLAYSQLYAYAKEADLAFRPHGLRISRGQGVAILNITFMLILTVFIIPALMR